MRQCYLHILFKYSQNFTLVAQVLAGLYPTEHACDHFCLLSFVTFERRVNNGWLVLMKHLDESAKVGVWHCCFDQSSVMPITRITIPKC